MKQRYDQNVHSSLDQIIDNVGSDIVGNKIIQLHRMLCDLKVFMNPIVGQRRINIDDLTQEIWDGEKWITTVRLT